MQQVCISSCILFLYFFVLFLFQFCEHIMHQEQLSNAGVFIDIDVVVLNGGKPYAWSNDSIHVNSNNNFVNYCIDNFFFILFFLFYFKETVEQRSSILVRDERYIFVASARQDPNQHTPVAVHRRPHCCGALALPRTLPFAQQACARLLPGRRQRTHKRVSVIAFFSKTTTRTNIFSKCFSHRKPIRLGFTQHTTIEQLSKTFPDLDYVDHQRRKELLVI